jgi:hypothetical protein
MHRDRGRAGRIETKRAGYEVVETSVGRGDMGVAWRRRNAPYLEGNAIQDRPSYPFFIHISDNLTACSHTPPPSQPAQHNFTQHDQLEHYYNLLSHFPSCLIILRSDEREDHEPPHILARHKVPARQACIEPSTKRNIASCCVMLQAQDRRRRMCIAQSLNSASE